MNQTILFRTQKAPGAGSLDPDLVLGARPVLGCADHQVNAAPLSRLVQMFPDGEHRSGSSTSALQPKRGEHAIDHLHVALQLHRSPEKCECCGLRIIPDQRGGTSAAKGNKAVLVLFETRGVRGGRALFCVRADFIRTD